MTDPAQRSRTDAVSEIVHPDEDLPGLLARLLDDLPVGIILYDARADFRISYANPVMEEWTAPEVRPLLGRTLREMFPGPNVDAIVAALAGIAQTGVPQNWRNFRFSRPGRPGEPDMASYWDWNAIPLKDPAGNVTHVMGEVKADLQPLTHHFLRRLVDRHAHHVGHIP